MNMKVIAAQLRSPKYSKDWEGVGKELVKSVVTGAIGSAAHASKDRFLPFFQHTMDRLQHFLVLTGEGEETELRGITVDAIGTFAEAVGKDTLAVPLCDFMGGDEFLMVTCADFVDLLLADRQFKQPTKGCRRNP